MPGEITNAELARRLSELSHRLEGVSTSVRSDLGEILRRMDAYVLREVYLSDQHRRDDQIETLRAQLQAERRDRDRTIAALRAVIEEERAEQRAAQERVRITTRWIWTAVIVPVGALIVQAIMSATAG